MVKDPFFLVTEKPTEVTVSGITETTPGTIPLRTPCATKNKSNKLFALKKTTATPYYVVIGVTLPILLGKTEMKENLN